MLSIHEQTACESPASINAQLIHRTCMFPLSPNSASSYSNFASGDLEAG